MCNFMLSIKNFKPNKNCSLSNSRIEAGAHFCRAISRINFTPSSKLGNTTDPYLITWGKGLIFSVTSVITPRVPSEPKIK